MSGSCRSRQCNLKEGRRRRWTLPSFLGSLVLRGTTYLNRQLVKGPVYSTTAFYVRLGDSLNTTSPNQCSSQLAIILGYLQLDIQSLDHIYHEKIRRNELPFVWRTICHSCLWQFFPLCLRYLHPPAAHNVKIYHCPHFIC